MELIIEPTAANILCNTKKTVQYAENQTQTSKPVPKKPFWKKAQETLEAVNGIVQPLVKIIISVCSAMSSFRRFLGGNERGRTRKNKRK